jgi:phenylpropionate dioxygenase-like ring-hydroxylating dioxygenase large terminal subunit
MNEPQTPGLALEARCYTDPALFEEEMRRIFYSSWIYAGHVSQLAKTGDYFTFSIHDQDLFTIRGRDGELRSFYNVCQHRAHELLEGSGNRRMIVCPYHAWSYELDGRLRKAPNSETTPGFDADSICLTVVRTEDFNGFIFVNLDPEAKPMDEWYPGAREELSAFVPDIDGLAPVLTHEIVERCNWKITVENYSECYHCALNHPTFAQGVIDPASYNIAPQGYCLRHTTRSAHLERMTYAIDPEANAHAGDYSSWFLWPAFSFQVYPGNVLNTYLWRPDSVDLTHVYRGWYSADGVESHVISRLAEQDLNTTVAEDIRLVESVQRGLKSRGYKTGPLILNPALGVNSEHSIKAIHDWVRQALA